MRVELTDGQWCELRDPARLTNKQRRPLQTASLKLGKFDDQGESLGVDLSDPDAVLDFGEALATALVESWSFPTPVPADDHASVDDMLGTDYDLIVKGAMELWTASQIEDVGKVPTS
jgi:hypothetical protein